MKVEKLNDMNFQSFIQDSNVPVVVDFWAPWCGPCQMMGPVIEEIAEELEEITFAKVNVDENNLIPSSMGISGIPTIVVFNKGKEIGRFSGFVPKQVLQGRIEAIVHKI